VLGDDDDGDDGDDDDDDDGLMSCLVDALSAAGCGGHD
jgi:hypothetical protein